MTMTKKDFELIADVIKKMQSLGNNHLYVADMFAEALGKTNPLFDNQRFLKACEVEA